MIVNKYNQGGGGSGSGMTPQQVQQQIDTSLTPYWDSGETKDYVDEAVSGISLEGYYTSAQTEEKIASADTIIYASAVTYVDNAVSGLATENYVDERLGPEVLNYNSVEELLWESGIFYEDEYGETAIAHVPSDEAISYSINQLQESIGEVSGTFAGYTPTTGFSTINGSAITTGGDIVIEGGGADLSAYYTSAQTEDAISAATAGKADAVSVSANNNSLKFPYWNSQGVITDAFFDSFTRKAFGTNGRNINFLVGVGSANIDSIYGPTTPGTAGDILVSTGNGAPVWSAVTIPDMSAYYTSAQTNTAISAATQNMVTSTTITTMWRGSQADYDTLTNSGATADSGTFYIIIPNNN